MFGVKNVITKYKILFKNLKLKQKISLSTTFILILSTFMTIVLLYGQFKNLVEKNSYKETHQMVIQLSNYYNEKLTKVINLTHGIFENLNFQQSLDNIVWDDQYNYAIEASTLQPLFHRTMLKDRVIDSFILYTPQGIFPDSIHKLNPDFEVEKTSIFKVFGNTPNISWGKAYADEFFESKKRVIPVVMSITTDRIYGSEFFIINLSEEELISPLKDINSSNKASVYIVNNDGQIITQSEYKGYHNLVGLQDFNKLINNGNDGSFKYTYNGEKLYINYSKIALNGWRVITVQQQDELLKEVQKLQLFVILIGFTMTTVAGLVAIIVASTVTRPLYKLRKTMQSVQEGQLDARFTNKYNDEIGQLGTSFNSMLDEMQILIRELEEERERTKEEQKLKVKAEIKALQAQINPHFLYNTLDSIYWKSKMGKNELASEMIISLSNLLRIGLSKGKDKIPVTAEIEHVKNYLYLQSNVYNDRFDYNVAVTGDISRCLTVKLILQPIVENAIFHGFDNIGYKGMINISVENIGNKVHFKVEDNGIGFDVEAIMSSLKDQSTETKGYALKNVYQRIVLNYGQGFGVNLESTPYEKTIIEIVIPTEE